MNILKNSLKVLIIISLSSIGSAHAQVSLNCESGNRAIEQGNCWGFGAVTYIERSSIVTGGRDRSVVINGDWSTRSNSMSNPDLASSWIKTPWMKVGSQNITLSTRLEGTTGTTKQLVVSYIPYNEAAGVNKEGALTTFYTFDYPQSGNSFLTTVQNLTIPIPVEIANSSDVYKIMISFVGTGGNNRAIADDIIIPGTYWADPANNCLPLVSSVVDSDGDGVGDVDDAYPDNAASAFNNYYPDNLTYGTLVFEDNWPGKGDYDMNDVVVDYQINRITNSANKVVELVAKFIVRASGAHFKNAFGFQLDGIAPEVIESVNGTSVGNSGDLFKFRSNGLEDNQEFANCIVFDNFFSVMNPSGGGAIGVNVDKQGEFVPYVEMTVTIPFATEIPVAELTNDKFNFYIVADIDSGDRGREIHLADAVPTSLANKELFGTSDDKSGPNRYYRTENNLPWAINIVQGFDYPVEKVSIDKAYNFFIMWAESNGERYQDWFSDKDGYRNPENIYTK